MEQTTADAMTVALCARSVTRDAMLDPVIFCHLDIQLHPQQSRAFRAGCIQLALEVAIIVNEFLWIHSTKPEHTILIQNKQSPIPSIDG